MTKRDEQTNLEKEEERGEARERMLTKRAEQNTQDKEERKDARIRMKTNRAEKTNQAKNQEKEEANDRMRIIRKMKSKAVLEYETIIQTQRMRKSRENASGKEHLIRNLKAKKGMRR